MDRILPLWHTYINNLNSKVNKLHLKDVLSTSYKIGRKYILFLKINIYYAFSELFMWSNGFRKFEESFHCFVWLCLSISINIIFVKMVWLKKERIMHVVACNNGLLYFWVRFWGGGVMYMCAITVYSFNWPWTFGPVSVSDNYK